MVFKRRTPRAWYENLKEWVWPSSGWGRMFKYLSHRVARIPASSYSIAAGVACGAAVSFTPFIGLHFIISMSIAWLIRGNVVAAAIGTAVGNPWTFPFIWVATYETGQLLIGGDNSVDILEFMDNISLLDDPVGSLKPVFFPLIIGSIPYVIISWAAVFFPARQFIEIRKARRARKKAKKAHALRRHDHDQHA